MRIEVKEHITLYKDPRFHAAFPSIIKLDNGGFLLAFRRARDCNWMLKEDKDFDPVGLMEHFDSRSHFCLINFDENLEPIGEPRIYPIDPEAGDQDPSLLSIGEGQILMSGFSWYPVPGYALKKFYSEDVMETISKTKGCGYYYWGSHSGLSNDHGQTWVFHHEYLEKTDNWENGIREKKYVGATRGQTLHVDDQLLLATYEGNGSALLWTSFDSGKNWVKKSVIAHDRETAIQFQEPSLYRAPSGKIIAFMRTQGADFRLATSQSYDNGITWKPYQLHDVKGQPFHALRLRNNQMLLCYGYREAPYGIRCRLLDDECDNISASKETILRDDGFCPDIGYPWGLELENGTLLIVYYWTSEEGYRQIQGTYLNIELSA